MICGVARDAHIVQINIDSAEMSENEIANRVSPLNGLGVIIKSV